MTGRIGGITITEKVTDEEPQHTAKSLLASKSEKPSDLMVLKICQPLWSSLAQGEIGINLGETAWKVGTSRSEVREGLG